MAVLFEKWRQAELEAAKTELETAIWQQLRVVPQTQAERKLNVAEINVAIAQKKGHAVEEAVAKKDLALARKELALARKDQAVARLMEEPDSEYLKKEHDTAVREHDTAVREHEAAVENFKVDLLALRATVEPPTVVKEEQRRQEQSGALGQHPFYWEFLDALFRKRPAVSVHSGVKTGWTKLE